MNHKSLKSFKTLGALKILRLSVMRGLLGAALFALGVLMLPSCDSVDDDRIPYADVHLTFHTVADWNIHGVKGDAADYCIYRFEPNQKVRIPADFPYTDLDRTGVGGILLVTDVMGNCLAYDLACPYEARANARLFVPSGQLYAECEACGSTFDIFTNHGNPRTGPAADRGYALKRYSVVSGGALNYRVVTR